MSTGKGHRGRWLPGTQDTMTFDCARGGPTGRAKGSCRGHAQTRGLVAERKQPRSPGGADRPPPTAHRQPTQRTEGRLSGPDTPPAWGSWAGEAWAGPTAVPTQGPRRPGETLTQAPAACPVTRRPLRPPE